jgi:hypothetical protein
MVPMITAKRTIAAIAIGVGVALMVNLPSQREAQRVSRNPAPPGTFKRRGGSNLGAGARGCAVSRDLRQIEREIAQAARWVVKWRMLQKEAVKIACGMGDPEARRQMLFISEGYRLLAERAEERRERLVAYAAAVKRGPC